MKKIVLLLGIMLSTYNIIYAQNFLNNLFGGENITKEISKKLNDAYELCIDINNIGSPEQIMKKANFETLCNFAGWQPTYSAACAIKANETYNKVSSVITSLEDAMLLAAKNGNDNLARNIRYTKDEVERIKENTAIAKKSSTLDNYNKYIGFAVIIAKDIPPKIRKLIESCK